MPWPWWCAIYSQTLYIINIIYKYRKSVYCRSLQHVCVWWCDPDFAVCTWICRKVLATGEVLFSLHVVSWYACASNFLSFFPVALLGQWQWHHYPFPSFLALIASLLCFSHKGPKHSSCLFELLVLKQSSCSVYTSFKYVIYYWDFILYIFFGKCI